MELRKVKNHSGGLFDSKETREPVLALTILVKNVSPGQVFLPLTVVTGKDNFGNQLDKVEESSLSSFIPEGSAEYHDLQPGRTATVIVCLKPKADAATSYEWELSQLCNNEKEYRDWTLKFDTAQISQQPVRKETASEPKAEAQAKKGRSQNSTPYLASPGQQTRRPRRKERKKASPRSTKNSGPCLSAIPSTLYFGHGGPISSATTSLDHAQTLSTSS